MPVNPIMITLGRELRGLTQMEMANAVGVSQSKVSKYEQGGLRVPPAELAAIAVVLDLTRAFFEQDERVYSHGTLFHRKRMNVPIRLQSQVRAQINVARMQAHRLLRRIDVEPALSFEEVDPAGYQFNPARVARALRATWRLPPGPVPNLTELIEAAGGIVMQCQFGTPKVDAAHLWVPGSAPMFYLNTACAADRQRFSLAHELGHAVLHRAYTEGELECEADAFAAEFLMPETDIRSDLRGIDLERAGRLKAVWRVSMQAIIRRARDLQIVSEAKYRRLLSTLSTRGMRSNEPFQFTPESPQLFRRLVDAHRNDLGMTPPELRELLFTNALDAHGSHREASQCLFFPGIGSVQDKADRSFGADHTACGLN